MSDCIPPPSDDGAKTAGLSIWLPSRDAQRLAVLARDYSESLGDALARLIAKAFGERGR